VENNTTPYNAAQGGSSTPTYTTVSLNRNTPSRTSATNPLFIRHIARIAGTGDVGEIILVRGTMEAIKHYYGLGKYVFVESVGGGGGIEGYSTYREEITSYDVLFTDCPKYQTKPAPPPEKRKRKCCEMSCCPQTRNPDNDALLRKILKRLEDIDKKTGEFPLELPESFISKREGFLGKLIPDKTLTINSHSEMWIQWLRFFDEIVGEFEIPIEIKDADPLKPGDQPVGMRIPNIAEGIAEMMGLLLDISINSETAVNMSARTLIEAGSTKLQGVTNYTYVKAIADYLNFKKENITKDVALSFTHSEEEFDKFLVESKVKAEGIQLSDDKDAQDFSKQLGKLLHAAAVIEAVFWRKLDPKKDLGKQFVNTIKGLSKAKDEIETKNDESEKEWSKFLTEVEEGHINKPGINDPINPYGGDYSERPRIREIGKNQNNNNS
jgi:hypothetical protein